MKRASSAGCSGRLGGRSATQMPRMDPTIRWVLLVAWLSLLVVTSPARPPRPISVATGEWEPFTGSDEKNHGVISEIVKATFNEMGLEPEISFYHWDVVENRTAEGNFLVAYPFVKTAQREKRFLFSDSLFEFYTVLFYNRTRLTNLVAIQSVADLRPYRIGLAAGYDVWDELSKVRDRFVPLPSIQDAFKALDKGEIDFVPEGRAAGELLLNSPHVLLDPNRFAYIPIGHGAGLSSREGLHLIMAPSSANRDFLRRFNEALRKVKQSSFYKTLKSKFREGNPVPLTVVLKQAGSYAMVFGREQHTDSESFLIPAGSRAVVLQWSPHFQAKGSLDLDREAEAFSRVKLLDGPLKGKLLYVPNRFLQIPAAAASP